MLDLDFIRRNHEVVRRAAELKNVDIDVDHLLAIDGSVLQTRKEIEELQRQRNANARAIRDVSQEERQKLIESGRRIGELIEEKKPSLARLEAELRLLLLRVPNIPSSAAPIGKDDSDNVVVRVVGDIPTFTFSLRDHVEILEKNNWAEFKRVADISGSRNYSLKNDALMLEQAIISFTMETLIAKGFDLMSVPSLVREEALYGTGHFPDGRDQVYFLPEDNLYLSGTAEVPINSLYKDEILPLTSLPLKIGGFSPCFRREAGSAGRDVRGLIRVHQFSKVEQFIICENSEKESEKWQNYLLSIAEEILNNLHVPYRIIECCTGDMGIGKFRMFDVESWVPSEAQYRETHSCSALHDWQARRTGLRYRDSEGKVRHCHTLNNTAIASPRILVPLLENHQQPDGSIWVPEVLRRYLGGRSTLGGVR